MGGHCPLFPNVTWAMDFQFDATTNARSLKLLNIIDENLTGAIDWIEGKIRDLLGKHRILVSFFASVAAFLTDLFVDLRNPCHS